MRSSADRKINPAVLLEIADAKTGLIGWLAIDSNINNHCWGGLRMVPDISALEMAELAKVMTLKYGFLGIPHGGAKAGILCDENVQREHKLRLLVAFGLNKIFYLTGSIPRARTWAQTIRTFVICFRRWEFGFQKELW